MVNGLLRKVEFFRLNCYGFLIVLVMLMCMLYISVMLFLWVVSVKGVWLIVMLLWVMVMLSVW